MRLLEIDESVSQQGPMPMMDMKRMVAVASPQSPPTPVEPGQVGTSVSLNTKLEMTR